TTGSMPAVTSNRRRAGLADARMRVFTRKTLTPVTRVGRIAPMRKLWAEFKAVAIGGNVLDLALGFIIGTAFATLIQSFASHVFLQLVAAIIGKRSFSDVVVTVKHTHIEIGSFLNDLLQFVRLAV